MILKKVKEIINNYDSKAFLDTLDAKEYSYYCLSIVSSNYFNKINESSKCRWVIAPATKDETVINNIIKYLSKQKRNEAFYKYGITNEYSALLSIAKRDANKEINLYLKWSIPLLILSIASFIWLLYSMTKKQFTDSIKLKELGYSKKRNN